MLPFDQSGYRPGSNLRRLVGNMISHLRARAGLILRIVCFAALALISGFLLAALNGDGTASAAGPDDGGGLLGAVTKPVTEVVDEVTAPVAPVVTPVAETVAPVVTPVAETVAPVVTPVAETVAPVVESVAPVVAPAAQAVAPIVEVVAPVSEAIAPVVAPVTGASGPVTQPAAPVVDPVTRPAAVVPPVGTSGGQPPSAPPAPVPSTPAVTVTTGPESGPAAPAAGSVDVAATIDRTLGTASGHATTDPTRRYQATPSAPVPPTVAEDPFLFTTSYPRDLVGAATGTPLDGRSTPQGPLAPQPVIAPSLASTLLGGGGDHQPTPLTVAILAGATATLFLLWRRIAPLVAWRSRRELSDIERPG